MADFLPPMIQQIQDMEEQDLENKAYLENRRLQNQSKKYNELMKSPWGAIVTQQMPMPNERPEMQSFPEDTSALAQEFNAYKEKNLGTSQGAPDYKAAPQLEQPAAFTGNRSPAAMEAPMPQGVGSYSTRSPEVIPGVGGLMDQLTKKQLESQQLQKENISSIQKRLEELQGAPIKTGGGLGQAIAMAADLWGGGGGMFSKMYQQAHPRMTEAEKRDAEYKLQDLLRKSTGELTQGDIDILKAQIGYKTDMAKLAKGEAGERLPAGQAAELADLKSAQDSVNNVTNEWIQTFGNRPSNLMARAGSKATASLDPTSPENIYEAKRSQWAQTIGYQIEGGKLTDKDFDRYLRDFIPSAFDTKEQAQAKLTNLNKYAEQRYQQKIKSFGKAGYNVKNYQQPSNALSQEEQDYISQYEKKYGVSK